jgi:outer membrane lipoprotein-sorting protein
MRTVIAFTMSLALLGGLLAQDAKTLLKQSQQKYRQMKSMEASMVFKADIQQGNNSMKQEARSTLAMQKPNKLAMKASGGPMGTREIYSDGKEVIAYLPAMKQYVKRDAPPNFEGPNAGLLGELGILFNFANENLDDPNSKAKYTLKGKKTVNGVETHVVEISEKRQNASTLIRLYVGVQDKLIHRLEMDQKMQAPPSQQGQPPQRFGMKVEADIRYVSIDKPIPDSRFKFTPPKDAKEMQMPTGNAPTPPPQGQR